MKYIISIFIYMLSHTLIAGEIVNIKKNYKITYGDFIDLGEMNTSIVIVDGKYKIEAISRPMGISALFSDSFSIYKSRGKHRDNKFIPYEFIKQEIDGDEKETKEIYFNHKNKSVRGFKKVFEKKDGYFIIKKRKDVNISEGMDNDIMSVLLNLSHFINNTDHNNEVKIRAVDASKEDGYFHMRVPTKKEKIKASKKLETSLKDIAIIYIDEPIFSSNRGELIVALGQDGVFKKAILQEVLFFGDIKLEEVE